MTKYEKVALGLTIGRLSLVGALGWAIVNSQALAVCSLFTVVIADVADGIVARRWHVDTNRRRIADTIVDKVTIHIAFVIAALRWPSLWGWYLPLLMRDAIAGAGYSHAIVSMRAVIVGDAWHKLAAITAGLFGLAVLTGSAAVIAAAAITASVVNWILLVDHVGTYLQVRRSVTHGLVSSPERWLSGNLKGVRGCLAWRLADVLAGGTAGPGPLLMTAEVMQRAWLSPDAETAVGIARGPLHSLRVPQ